MEMIIPVLTCWVLPMLLAGAFGFFVGADMIQSPIKTPSRKSERMAELRTERRTTPDIYSEAVD